MPWPAEESENEDFAGGFRELHHSLVQLRDEFAFRVGFGVSHEFGGDAFSFQTSVFTAHGVCGEAAGLAIEPGREADVLWQGIGLSREPGEDILRHFLRDSAGVVGPSQGGRIDQGHVIRDEFTESGLGPAGDEFAEEGLT